VAGSINRVVIVGNLTRDPELKATPGGMSICSMRVAVNDRVKDQNTGEWGEKPNYFNVDVFGGQGERCAQYLARGRQVAVEGRLRWREWQTQEGQKREAVTIVADNVQFIGPREGGQGGTGGGDWNRQPASATGAAAGAAPDPWPADAPAADDEDIPF
jgi:single-strand DNA-binding protein